MYRRGSDVPTECHGLTKHRINISSNGNIYIQLGSKTRITIGEVETLLSRPEFTDGMYKTKNGVKIPVKKYIKHMRIDTEMVKALAVAEQQKVCDTHPFTERLTLFYGLLYSRFSGTVTDQEPSNKSV